MAIQLDTKTWAETQFSNCELGDLRRTKRLIRVAEEVANHPAGSFPAQFEAWGDLKAAYRLLDSDGVTFQSIAEAHWRQTCDVGPGRYLVLGDTTEVDFGSQRDVPGLSDIGNGSGNGFLLHNGLFVESESEQILGVAGQTIHYRKPAPKQENNAQRLKRERESRVWGDVIEQIGPPPSEAQFVHVFDRGGDDFEVFCRLRENRGDWVIRAKSLNRKIVAPDGERCKLSDYMETLPVAGCYDLNLRARPGQPARTAQIEVRFGALQMPRPQHLSTYVKALQPEPLEMHVVWVRETNPPKGKKPIEWVLYTSLRVNSFDDSWTVIRYYECRWLIEEYHKALKTGCRVERRQLHSADRLEAMVGLMSVVAVRLVQLKTMARTEPDRPAKSVVPERWLQMLKAARKNLRRVHDLTIYQFYRELAKLGGFLGRKSDGEPGWITVWRGWEKLNTLIRGAELAGKFKKCG